ncbi:MAG TPA: DUF86 domain-containing protein [Candidatus Pacearchaeota archaeon]|nr:hypothetical protein BMS3Abin17_00631 [archaeon BMS3Abin17]HDK42302.1 DUF86 domain-containing protein [Candidatus Pacearchaeota archaeon]HDZ60663.1 DUF86 domain-containing protein [Candidatus Pacearchaeota archaeon]
MKRDLKLFIKDILENINLIQESVKGLTKKQFETNRLVVDATLRRLEVMGEAVKNLPDSFTKKYKNIPWKDIARFRDVLIHAYFGINLDRVWNIIKRDMPVLKKEISRIKL